MNDRGTSSMDRIDEDRANAEDLAEIKRLLNEAGVPWRGTQASRVEHVLFCSRMVAGAYADTMRAIQGR